LILQILINLAIGTFLIIAPAYYQAHLFKNNISINHFIWASGLVGSFLLLQIVWYFLKMADFNLLINWVIFFIFGRFLFFDYYLNKLRGKPTGYLGNNKIDLFLKWLSNYANIAFIRVGAFMVAGFFIIGANTDFWSSQVNNLEFATGAIIFISILFYGLSFMYRFFNDPFKL
jgi:hypothetical protein